MFLPLTKNMSSSQTQQSDAQQRRRPQLANRRASDSFEPDSKPSQRATSVESTSSETKLSHYLHYHDNDCFFAPDWLDRRVVEDREHDIQS